MKQNGAAISLVSAETVGAILELYFGRNYFHGIKCTHWLLSSLLSSALMGLAIALFLSLHLGFLTLVIGSFVVGVIVYFSVLLLCRDSIIIKVKDRLVSRFCEKCWRY
jgi:uncharacterized membrane protein YoaK (UPF0700 family)